MTENDRNTYQRYECIVLFYRYFLPSTDDDHEYDKGKNEEKASQQQKKQIKSSSCKDNKQSFYSYSAISLFHNHSDYYMPKLQQFLKNTCSKLRMRGRILLSPEGINGTLSSIDKPTMDQFVDSLENFDLLPQFGYPPSTTNIIEPFSSDNIKKIHDGRLFSDIDWKYSIVDENGSKKNCMYQHKEPFPDLKVALVKEIVSSGGAIDVSDISSYGGKHLTAEEFHQTLMESWCTNDNKNTKELVLIDVRNPFEYDIGHFQSPDGSVVAVNPQMSTFATFDNQFCARQAENLKDKKVLMYCTGGIRCEKASAMLRKRGVTDVNQLSGGIHRYLETYGNSGLFQGKNFVFDQRVTMNPSSAYNNKCIRTTSPSHETISSFHQMQQQNIDVVIGKCVSCSTPYDEYSGSRICTVCRDLVLICPICCQNLREYHCPRHSAWKYFYFTFLEVFTEEELTTQLSKLQQTIEQSLKQLPTKKGSSSSSSSSSSIRNRRNMRQTLLKQAKKVQKRISALQEGLVMVDKNATQKCRYCFQTNDLCNGLCWGFWKQRQDEYSPSSTVEVQLPIKIGDKVEPGLEWNEMRLGKKNHFTDGTVVEIKTWGSGSDTCDCVSVQWTNDSQKQIYKWGVLARNGNRMYDLQKVKT